MVDGGSAVALRASDFAKATSDKMAELMADKSWIEDLHNFP